MTTPAPPDPPRSPIEDAKTAARWIFGCAGAVLLLALILAALIIHFRPILKG